jgi:hypothetical protein
MQYLYDRAFKIGVVVTVVIFALLNVVSYIFARLQYQRLAEANQLVSDHIGWGFPFNWTEYSGASLFMPDEFMGLVLNFGFAVGCAFVVGLIARKFSHKGYKRSVE